MQSNTPVRPQVVFDPVKGWRNETYAEAAARVKAADDERYKAQQDRLARKDRAALFASIHAASVRHDG